VAHRSSLTPRKNGRIRCQLATVRVALTRGWTSAAGSLTSDGCCHARDFTSRIGLESAAAARARVANCAESALLSARGHRPEHHVPMYTPHADRYRRHTAHLGLRLRARVSLTWEAFFVAVSGGAQVERRLL
jgi:hypothetical protein